MRTCYVQNVFIWVSDMNTEASVNKWKKLKIKENEERKK